MVNPYLALTTYEGSNWKSFFEQLGVLDVFGELLGTFTAPESMRKIIRYILWTYSASSERIIGGMDWENNKKNNFNHAGLPGELWDKIGMLQDLDILRAIHRWLEFQDDAVFKQLQCLRDLKMEMQISAVGKINKSSGETDYDQKYKNANYAVELEKTIQQLENQSINNNPSLKDGNKEIKSLKRHLTTGPEAFAK